MNPVLSWAKNRLAEPESRAAIGAAITALVAWMLGGADLKTMLIAELFSAVTFALPAPMATEIVKDIEAGLKKVLIPAVLILGTAITLSACSTATKVQSDIELACNAAMTLAPISGPVAPWIIGGCASEEAVAKLATDPSSVMWVKGLISTVTSMVSGKIS